MAWRKLTVAFMSTSITSVTRGMVFQLWNMRSATRPRMPRSGMVSPAAPRGDGGGGRRLGRFGGLLHASRVILPPGSGAGHTGRVDAQLLAQLARHRGNLEAFRSGRRRGGPGGFFDVLRG